MVVANMETMIKQGGSHAPVALPRYEYISGQFLTMDETSIAGTIPPNTDTIYMRSRGGDVWWNINVGHATGMTTGGFTPENWIEAIGPIVNFTSIHFYGAAGAFIHISYLREVW